MMKVTDFTYLNNHCYKLENFGFKIHISATSENYNEIFNLVYPFLKDQQICSKYLNSSDLIEFNFSDREIPAESGKFFTIYPKNREHCMELLDKLYAIIPKETDGIYILSDRAYKDSQVIFYRYGAIAPKDCDFDNNLPTIYGPNGEKWQDYQKTYFDLPAWIKDIQEPLVVQDSYLSQQYQIESLLKQSNGGNVYLAVHRQTHQPVVIKESKPHIICFDKIKRESLRLHEWELAQQIAFNTPQPLETVKEWINQYYIYEYIQGESLRTYCDARNLFSYSASNPQENFGKFLELITCFQSLLETVASLHRQGLVLNDIHPDNFLITKDGEVIFIDLENSYRYGTEPLVGIYHDISLKTWNKLDGYLADCHKLGQSFLYLLGRLHHKEAHVNQLLLQKGIAADLEKIIIQLLSPSADINQALQDIKNLTITCTEPPNYRLPNLDRFQTKDLLDLTELILIHRPNLVKEYPLSWDNEEDLIKKLHSEKQLGLDGLAGILVYLRANNFPSKIIKIGLEYLLKHLVTVDDFKGIPISDYSVSPYLGNGTAGLILLLLDLREVELAEELSPILFGEFAQFLGIWDGMLGIAYTLLRLFETTLNSLYLHKAKELIISCLFINQSNVHHKRECLYLLAYYSSLINKTQT